MIKLSIIIPAYNCENTIEKCVNSIKTQKKFGECELIIVNDGSRDNTKNIVSNLISENIRVVNQFNQGVSAARNRGIQECQGKYLMFVDSDDFLIKNSLSEILKNVEKNEKSLVIYGLNQEFYKNDKLYRCDEKKFKKNMELNLDNDFDEILELLESNLINGPYAKIFETDIIKKNNIIFNNNLKIQEDLEFNINYISYCSHVFIDTHVVYRYIINSTNSITSTFIPERIVNYAFVEKKIYNFFSQKDISEKQQKRLYYISVKNTWSAIINTYYYGNKFNYFSRRKFIKEILNKCNFIYIEKSKRDGIKYFVIKLLLLTKNVFLLQIFSFLMSFIKKNFFINYR